MSPLLSLLSQRPVFRKHCASARDRERRGSQQAGKGEEGEGEAGDSGGVGMEAMGALEVRTCLPEELPEAVALLSTQGGPGTAPHSSSSSSSSSGGGGGGGGGNIPAASGGSVLQLGSVLRKGLLVSGESLLPLVHHELFAMRLPLMEILVAVGPRPGFGEDGTVVLGAAMISHRYSTWSGRRVFLHGLVVSPKHRRRGIGTRIVELLAQGAIKYSAEAMEWQIEPGAEGQAAILFSERLGAHGQPIEQWHDCEWPL